MDFVIPDKCMVCEEPIIDQGSIICQDCGKSCDVFALNQEEIDNTSDGEVFGINVKSKCCKADVSLSNIRGTCSDECHEKHIENMEKRNGGKFIYDIDRTGKMRKIPLRIVIEKGGLTEDELMQFPEVISNGKA